MQLFGFDDLTTNRVFFLSYWLKRWLIIVITLFSGVVSDGYAATVTNTNDGGPGSLRDAIAATPAGGTVNFALSGCPCAIILTGGELLITKNLTIFGPGAEQLTISGNSSSRVFRITGPNIPSPNIVVVLDGLKIANGRVEQNSPSPSSDLGGGGILSVNALLTIRNFVVSNNFAGKFGGGISSMGNSDLTVINSIISRNESNIGSGISFYSGYRSLKVIDSVISDNKGTGFFSFGGGIYSNFFTNNQIINSTIARNEAAYASGAYIFQYSTVQIANSTFEGNTSNAAGTLVIQITNTSIINSTISGNTALNGSAGIIHENLELIDVTKQIHSRMTITNSTITDNRGSYSDGGSGIITSQEPGYPATTILRNSIVAGNAFDFNSPPADVLSINGGVFASEGYNLIGNAGAVTVFNQSGDQSGTSAVPLNPKLEPLAFNGGTTKTHALRFDSPALDHGFAFGLVTDQRGFSRPNDLTNIPNSPGSDGSDIGAFESGEIQRRTGFDFDGDGKADISVFRSSDSVWYLNRSTQGFSTTQFGLSTDKIAPADYDGDGKTDISVYRDGVWYWLKSSDNSFNAVQFGLAGDIPVPADYTGDGRAELAVYRGGVWWTFDLANQQTGAIQFGISSDKPVAADYDGDGSADQAVYRNGEWHLNRSTQGYAVIHFGLATDNLVPADYDGDGRTDIAVYRDGIWYLQQSSQGFAAFQFGVSTDIPAPADYDGDGRTDAAVYRNGAWWIRQSTSGVAVRQFGLVNDLPVPAAFLP